jgi:hypothetical protein
MKDQLAQLENRLQKNRWHMARLEQILKLLDSEDMDPSELGYFIVGLFCYICSFLLFVWLFFFTYALLAVVYVSHVEDRSFNTPRL